MTEPQSTRQQVAQQHPRGLADTDVIILLERLAPADLPASLLISTVTLAEMAAGVHSAPDSTERATRTARLQRTEASFIPLPFTAEAARQYGVIAAQVIAPGRTPRSRVADLMIASVAAVSKLPLFTTNPADFAGADQVVTVVPVPVPSP